MPEEEKELVQILERYLPELEIEITDTDGKEFRADLKKGERIMVEFIRRLKAVVH